MLKGAHSNLKCLTEDEKGLSILSDKDTKQTNAPCNKYMNRKDILKRKTEILQWVSEKRSKHYMCEQLSCKQETLNSYLEKMGIEYEGNQSHKGYTLKNAWKPIEKYFNNEIYINSHALKKRLLKEGIKDHICEQCGLKEWQNLPIPLELHHIDGNHYNNNFDNLKLLCPNCHALTDNYSGKGTKSFKEKQSGSESKSNYCVDCGMKISRKSKRCKACSQQAQRKQERPSREKLKEYIRKYPITKIGIMYKVSDNAIRKWCKKYSLPHKSVDIKKYSDTEWETI